MACDLSRNAPTTNDKAHDAGNNVPQAVADHLKRDAITRIRLSIGGVRCGRCVASIKTVFDKYQGSIICRVSVAKGTIDLRIAPAFDLVSFANELKLLGFSLSEISQQPTDEAGRILPKMGVSCALAGNVMMLSLAEYFGLSEASLIPYVRGAAILLLVANVVVGGGYFFREAYVYAKQKMFHFSAPIALGIAFGTLGVVARYFVDGRADYADGLSVFIALMLVGRYVQQRALEKARAQLAVPPKLSAIKVRRIFSKSNFEREVQWVAIDSIKCGDVLQIARGEIIPCASKLLAPSESERAARFSLEWINGESEPQVFDAGKILPAGAMLASTHAIRIQAQENFIDGALPQIAGLDRQDKRTAFWENVSRRYSQLITLVGLLGLSFWWAFDGFAAGLSVGISVWVVACPCALGIAMPMVFQLASTRLRTFGLFVQQASTLERLAEVDEIAFDKTGTLTNGIRAHASEKLTVDDESCLRALVASSFHPKACAVADLLGTGVIADFDEVIEDVGYGLIGSRQGKEYRLGSLALCQ